jgi:hypothetical protein
MAIELESHSYGDGVPIRTVGRFLDADDCPATISLRHPSSRPPFLSLFLSWGDPPHLSRENCETLWPLLKRFAETGTLAETGAPDAGR